MDNPQRNSKIYKKDKSKTFSQLTEDVFTIILIYIMNSVQRLNDNGEEIP